MFVVAFRRHYLQRQSRRNRCYIQPVRERLWPKDQKRNKRVSLSSSFIFRFVFVCLAESVFCDRTSIGFINKCFCLPVYLRVFKRFSQVNARILSAF